MDENRIMTWGGAILMCALAAIGIGAHLLGIGADAAPDAVAAGAAPPAADTAADFAVRPTGAAFDPESCDVRGPAVPLPPDLHESSGVAASRRQPGVFWTHNDSGDPVLRAVRADGRVVGAMRLENATVTDWEDVAAGPCPGGECLYVGDIGDNEAARPYVTIYRVAEPAPGDEGQARVETFHARYPDGPHDAEALFVLPTGQVYVVTKGETGPVGLYRLPADARPGSTATLEHVRNVTQDEVRRRERVTAAAASGDGRWIALRTLATVAIYPADEFLRGDATPARELDLSPLREPQGEAVDFGPGGTLVLTSEAGSGGGAATIATVRCAP